MSLVGGYGADPSSYPKSQQKRPYGLFSQQGDLIPGDLDRNSSRDESPAESGNG